MAALLIFWDPKVTISWCFPDAWRLWGFGICDAILIFWDLLLYPLTKSGILRIQAGHAAAAATEIFFAAR